MLNEQAFGYPGANCRSCSNSPRSSYWVRESLVFLTRVSSVLGLSYYSSYYLRITHWEFLTSCLSYFLFLHLTNTLHTRYVAGIGLGPGCSWNSNSKQDTICYLGACSVEEKDKPIIIDQCGACYDGGSRRYCGSMGKGNLPWLRGWESLRGGSKVKGRSRV